MSTMPFCPVVHIDFMLDGAVWGRVILSLAFMQAVTLALEKLNLDYDLVIFKLQVISNELSAIDALINYDHNSVGYFTGIDYCLHVYMKL